MDTETLKTYQAESKAFIEKYSHLTPRRLHQLIDMFFVSKEKTLDIGCASGRELKYLKERGYEVEGLDATKAFVDHCKESFPNLKVYHDSLPKLDNIPNKTGYQNILLSAVLMHLNGAQLIEAISNILRVAQTGARIIVSIRTSIAHNTKEKYAVEDEGMREEDGRLFYRIPTGKIIHLFQSFGADLLFEEEHSDATKKDILWKNFVFEKVNLSKKSGIDSIQEIITKDKKDTSYKLSLLRSIVHLSKYEGHVAAYDDYRDYVYVPLKRLAFHNLKFYFPIFKNSDSIRQSRTHKNLAFQRPINDLPYGANELALLIDEYDEGSNRHIIDPVLKKIAKTIKEQPMKYTGMKHYSTFTYMPPSDAKGFIQLTETDFGMMGIPVPLWHDIILYGHWIEDSLLLQWAKLTEKINKDEKFPEYLKLLSEPILAERTTSDVRNLFHNQSIECVYTGSKVKKYEVDHIIPYSIWKNNDIWNLLPSTKKVNRNKSNCIPDPIFFHKRKDAVISYWEIYNKEFPERFRYQLNKTFGIVHKTNWENKAFLGLIEILTRLKVHKIAETWYYTNK